MTQLGDNTGGQRPGGDDNSASDGARNPWLPDSTAPRRSAGLDDILRPGAQAAARPHWLARFGSSPRGLVWQVLAGLGVVWLAVTSLHQLGPREAGVVSTLGRYERTIGPGLSLTWPWPFQRVAVRDTATLETLEVPAAGDNPMLTGDHFLVNLGWQLRWTVSDPRRFAAATAQPQAALRAAGAAGIRTALAGTPLVVLADDSRRAPLEQAARARAQAEVDRWGLGVRIEGLTLRRVEPPARLADGWAKVQAANADVARLQDQTEAYGRELTARAEADAAAFDKALVQYRAAPALTRKRLYYEMMDNVLARNPKVVGAPGPLVLPGPRRVGSGATP
jgi:membrane protease subunit HflK